MFSEQIMTSTHQDRTLPVEKINKKYHAIKILKARKEGRAGRGTRDDCVRIKMLVLCIAGAGTADVLSCPCVILFGVKIIPR